MSTPTVAVPTPRSRWLKIALALSLALNLLLLGLIAGRVLSRQSHMRMGERGDRLAYLPDEVRDEVRRSLEEHRPGYAERLAEARAARQRAREALAAEPFDAARAAAAMAEMRAKSLALQEEIHGAVVEAAAKLPPEARRQLSEWRRPQR